MGVVSSDRALNLYIQETIQVWSQSLRAQVGFTIPWLCDVQQVTHSEPLCYSL